MLWKAPALLRYDRNRVFQPNVKPVDCKAKYSRTDDRLTISGKFSADQPAHSVLVLEQQSKTRDDYWFRTHSTRLASDGTFQVTFDHPPKIGAHYLTRFCFDNGAVTGDNAAVTFGRDGNIKFGNERPTEFVPGRSRINIVALNSPRRPSCGTATRTTLPAGCSFTTGHLRRAPAGV